jgi:hypothetical protein
MNAPTWFLTLSSADTQWPEFFKLYRPHGSTDEGWATRLAHHPEQREKLLAENPVMAARLFHCRMEAFRAKILCGGKQKVLGQVLDYWFRIEFQVCTGERM